MSVDGDAWNTQHQQNLIDLADDLAELDAAQLGPVDRARQVRAQEALWVDADAMWDAVKATKARRGKPGNT